MARKKTPDPPPPTWDERLIAQATPWRVEIAGGTLFILAIIVLLTLPGWQEGGLLGVFVKPFKQLFGWGAYPLTISAAFGGIHLLLRRSQRPYTIHTSQIIGFEILLITALPVAHLLSGAALSDAYAGKGGGIVGWALSEPLIAFLGAFLAGLIYLIFLLWGTALLLRFTWGDLLQTLNAVSLRLRLWAQRIAPQEREVKEEDNPSLPFTGQPLREHIVMEEAGAVEEIGETAVGPRRDKRLPPLDVLEKGAKTKLSPDELEQKKETIEQALADFGLPAEVVEIRSGPAVTQFGVLPGYIEKPAPDGGVKLQKVRIGQISALRKDLALALAAPRLRIQAPIPGRGVVGIEVPNAQIDVVRLRPIVEAEVYTKLNSPLAVGLGRDVGGFAAAADLSKLPHLLMAGTTGSGKSACVNAMIAALIFNNTPDKLNLVMIDPKKVELIRFNGIPHLIGKVEVEPDRAVGVLRWLTAEMDRRYELFTQIGAKNLNSYNRKIVKKKAGKKLPCLAVFIDELADLMLIYPADVERTLCRLAQMARATGIHLVVATQRPSTDVITGLIKANFPARLSFAVASSTDSRVILDSTGAEQLLGKGDMLFLAPDAGAPMRIQGAFVNDIEIERIVEHWQCVTPAYDPIPTPWDSLIARHAILDETDSLLEQAIELAQKYDHLSTSLMQRRLRIGYPRAARIMEHLYEMGLVEDPKQGGKTRKTYVSEEDEDPLGEFLQKKDGKGDE